MTDTDTPVLEYLFVDLEASGLDENQDDIVEFGVIGTDASYRPLFEVETLVAPSGHTLDRIFSTPPVIEMMSENGLLEDLISGYYSGLYPSLATVEQDLLTLIDRFTPSTDSKVKFAVTLSGSGVATYDFRMLKVQTPELAKRLTYWTNDIGGARRRWRKATGVDLTPVNKDKTHRAFDDVLCHLEEARTFDSVFSRLARAAGGGDLASINAFLDSVERGLALHQSDFVLTN